MTLLIISATALLWTIIWYVFFHPRKIEQKNEYLKLYIKIQEKLYQINLSASELKDIRKMICLLESMKYKNSEMTEVVTLQWIIRKYGMTTKEMAETIGN